MMAVPRTSQLGVKRPSVKRSAPNPGQGFTAATVRRYAGRLADEGKAASTQNVRLDRLVSRLLWRLSATHDFADRLKRFSW